MVINVEMYKEVRSRWLHGESQRHIAVKMRISWNTVKKYCKRKQVHGFEFGYARYMAWEITKAQLAKELHISHPTLDKRIYEYELKSYTG